MPKISVPSPSNKLKFALAAAAAALGLGTCAVLNMGGDEETPQGPAGTEDTADRVDPNQHFFIVTRPTNVYQNPQPGAGIVALLRPGDCVALPGAKSEHTTTLILTEDGRQISGYSGFEGNYRNTDEPIGDQSECTAALTPTTPDGLREDLSFYIITPGATTPPLYSNPQESGAPQGYIEGCLQAIGARDTFTRVRVVTPEGERTGYVKDILAFGVFQHRVRETRETCRGTLASQSRAAPYPDAASPAPAPGAP